MLLVRGRRGRYHGWQQWQAGPAPGTLTGPRRAGPRAGPLTRPTRRTWWPTHGRTWHSKRNASWPAAAGRLRALIVTSMCNSLEHAGAEYAEQIGTDPQSSARGRIRDPSGECRFQWQQV